MKTELCLLRINYQRMIEKITMKIAWMMPRNLVMWCLYRALANATQGKYGNECPDKVTAFTVIDRWDDV